MSDNGTLKIKLTGGELFHTDLGLAMKVIKHQKEDADEVIKETNHRKIDRDTAFFLNRAVNLGLEYEEKDGGIDMCLALEKKYKDIVFLKCLRNTGKFCFSIQSGHTAQRRSEK